MSTTTGGITRTRKNPAKKTTKRIGFPENMSAAENGPPNAPTIPPAAPLRIFSPPDTALRALVLNTRKCALAVWAFVPIPNSTRPAVETVGLDCFIQFTEVR